MGYRQTPHPLASSTTGWTRAPTDRRPRCAQRHPVDLAHRGAVEGFAGPIPLVPDLPSSVPGVGAIRGVGADPPSPGPGSEGAWQAGSRGVLHRWDLHPREKGGPGVGKTKRGKGSKVMAVADRTGLPLATWVASASPHEVTLVESTLEARFVEEVPRRLIGDRAYDSDPLDERLAAQGIEMIAPHRKNRKKPRTQDGRPLRRYRRRWKVERLFAWLGNFRRLLVRYERHLANYLGFVHLGCIVILLRHF